MALSTEDWQNRAAHLRKAINNTTYALRECASKAEPAVIEHLEFLLAQEKVLLTFVAQAAEPKADAPWYPDASGEWVEFNGNNLPPAGSRVCVLSKRERADKVWNTFHSAHGDRWDWISIAAYKVMKPEAGTPWYPDNSGEWVETHGAEALFPDGTNLELLLCSERRSKTYQRQVTSADHIRWTTICAYKVVK